MRTEVLGYVCLAIAAVFWLGALMVAFAQVLPFGVIGVVGLAGVASLLLKVVRERCGNEEDDYYTRNVER